MTPDRSLDKRYLEFSTKSQAAFSAYPQLEPLRLFVFKELLVRRRTDGWWQHAAHWLRPLRRRARTAIRHRADVLIWLGGRREVVWEAVLPVHRELVRRGVSVALITDGAPAGVPATAVPFQCPARALAPGWAWGAWEALAACEPTLRARSLCRSFLHACAVLQALLDELDRLLATIGPKTVLVASTQLVAGAALTVAARAHHVTSLLLQHGMLQPFYTPLLADRMLTWGPSSDETMLALGVPRARLVATGSPRHDAMKPSGDGRARTRLLRALGLPNRPTFVFFSNGNDLVRNGTGPAECADWLEAAARWYADDLNVVVRLHPNEDGSLYRDRRQLTVTRNTPALGDTLDGCDWLASLCSTVLYDGLLYGKPIWQLQADDWPLLADNWKQGLALRVASDAQLCGLVGTMLAARTERRVDEPLVARVFANHGRATQVVADVVTSRLGRPGAERAVVSGHGVGVTGG